MWKLQLPAFVTSWRPPLWPSTSSMNEAKNSQVLPLANCRDIAGVLSLIDHCSSEITQMRPTVQEVTTKGGYCRRHDFDCGHLGPKYLDRCKHWGWSRVPGRGVGDCGADSGPSPGAQRRCGPSYMWACPATATCLVQQCSPLHRACMLQTPQQQTRKKPARPFLSSLLGRFYEGEACFVGVSGEQQRLREAGARVGRTNAALSGAVTEGDKGIGKVRVWDRSGLGGLRVGRCIGATPPSFGKKENYACSCTPIAKGYWCMYPYLPPFALSNFRNHWEVNLVV